MFRRGVSLLVLVWIIVGIYIAYANGYLTSQFIRELVSAGLAILLWPLLLLGIDLRV